MKQNVHNNYRGGDGGDGGRHERKVELSFLFSFFLTTINNSDCVSLVLVAHDWLRTPRFILTRFWTKKLRIRLSIAGRKIVWNGRATWNEKKVRNWTLHDEHESVNSKQWALVDWSVDWLAKNHMANGVNYYVSIALRNDVQLECAQRKFESTGCAA